MTWRESGISWLGVAVAVVSTVALAWPSGGRRAELSGCVTTRGQRFVDGVDCWFQERVWTWQLVIAVGLAWGVGPAAGCARPTLNL